MDSMKPFPLRKEITKDPSNTRAEEETNGATNSTPAAGDAPATPFFPNLNVRLMCPDCKVVPPHIIEEFAAGDLVCGDCGLVLGDRIVDTRSEWRTFANDEGDDPSRVGAAANPFLDGSQLDTGISRRDGGSGAARDLNKVHARATAVKGERQLVQAYREISVMCDAIALSKLVSDIAKQLYKRVEDEKLLRGKSSDAIIASCIFIACRQEKVGRTFKEICALTKVPKKEIGKCYKILQFKLQTNTTVMSSEDLMSRFCSHLHLPQYVQKTGVDLVKRVNDRGTLAGKSPISVAAACIYLVSTLYRTPKSAKEIALVAGVSETTIKNAYKSLYKERHLLVNVDELNARVRGEELSFEDLPVP